MHLRIKRPALPSPHAYSILSTNTPHDHIPIPHQRPLQTLSLVCAMLLRKEDQNNENNKRNNNNRAHNSQCYYIHHLPSFHTNGPQSENVVLPNAFLFSAASLRRNRLLAIYPLPPFPNPTQFDDRFLLFPNLLLHILEWIGNSLATVLPRMNRRNLPYVKSAYWPSNALSQAEPSGSAAVTFQILNHTDSHVRVQLNPFSVLWQSLRT